MSRAISVIDPLVGASLATTPAGSSGMSRAAIALIALGVDAAAQVLKHLPAEQAELLSAEMAQLGQLDEAVLDATCNELIAATGSLDSATGGIGFTRDVLVRVVGAERADELINQFLGGEVRPLDFTRTMSAEEVAQLLEGESPQTIALVVGNVRPGLSGRVLDILEPALQADVAYRVARLTTIDPRILRDIDEGLREKAAHGVSSQAGDPIVSGVEILAQILQGAGRATERQVLGGLEAVDLDLATQVRARLFTFEDMVKLTDKDLQLVLREIDGQDLVVALRGVAPELMERVVGNMSQRAGETLVEELEMQAPRKRAIVEEAQTKVVAAIRRLDEAGSITLPGAELESDGSVEVLL